MGSSDGKPPLRVSFLPMLSPGHILPMIDMAKLFAKHGFSATIITTPGNERSVRPAIDRANSYSPPPAHPINLILVPFPSAARHLLPGGHESMGAIRTSERVSFMMAFYSLKDPLMDLIRSNPPDCLVSDSMFTWTAATARDLGIPRLVYHGNGLLPLCIHHSVELNQPHVKVANDDEPFVVPDLPHRVSMKRPELCAIFQSPDLVAEVRASEEISYGVIVNSFYELEPDYSDHYRKWPGRRAWNLGPLSLWDKANQAPAGSEFGAWFSWLDSKPASSVVYMCFGSICELSAEQLREIALGLEASGHPFIWVVRGGEVAVDGWMPEGFLKRIDGRGLVITEWAPQVLILDHPSVGAFVTHCGWNSVLEGVSAGLPMATWPLEFDHFVNEKLVIDFLKIGARLEENGKRVLTRGSVAGAVESLMGAGEEAQAIRQRAKDYGAKARAAVAEGGSSHVDMLRLVEELFEWRRRRSEDKGEAASH